MKFTKSLLLGSAAGLMAASGAFAADLPVKAKAVEYVKICSLYGAGFGSGDVQRRLRSFEGICRGADPI